MSQTPLRPGKYAGVMPDMRQEEFEALKRSIEADGLKHPIEIIGRDDVDEGLVAQLQETTA